MLSSPDRLCEFWELWKVLCKSVGWTDMPKCRLQANVTIYIKINFKINLVPDDRGVKRLKVGLSRCPHVWHCLLTKICHEPNPNPRTTSPIVPSSPPLSICCVFLSLSWKSKGKRFVQMKCNKNMLVVCIWNFPCSCSYLAHLPISSCLLLFIIIINIITATTININMHMRKLRYTCRSARTFLLTGTLTVELLSNLDVHVWDEDRDGDGAGVGTVRLFD